MKLLLIIGMVLALLMPMAAGAMTVKVMNDGQSRLLTYYYNNKAVDLQLRPWQEVKLNLDTERARFHFPGMKDSYGKELFTILYDKPDVANYVVVPGGHVTIYK